MGQKEPILMSSSVTSSVPGVSSQGVQSLKTPAVSEHPLKTSTGSVYKQ